MKRNVFAAIFASFILVFAACGANAADNIDSKASAQDYLQRYFHGNNVKNVHFVKCENAYGLAYDKIRETVDVKSVTFLGNEIPRTKLPPRLSNLYQSCRPVIASVEGNFTCVNIYDSKKKKTSRFWDSRAKLYICETDFNESELEKL